MSTATVEHCRRGVRPAAHVATAVFLATSAALAQTETIKVDVNLRTGGALGGLVVDHTSHGLVIVADKTPYVFAWSELQPGSACAARRALLILERGGTEKLSGEDHFDLGSFALAQGRNDIAANEFRRAEERDASYKPLIREAFDKYRRQHEATRTAGDSVGLWKSTRSEDETLQRRSAEDTHGGLSAARRTDGKPDEIVPPVETSGFASLPDIEGAEISNHPAPEIRTKVSNAYRTFGEKVREVMGKDIALVESDHFLIWTDWPVGERGRLSDWCEAMYAALCDQFGLDPHDDIFLAKCPVFCFRSKGRFRRFAREFDGYGGKNAIGYTRSIERNGHVHMVLVRPGRSTADLDRFACTLVHEGTHAFLHRLYSSTLIPHWVGEGYADLIADRVLGDRCPAAGNAALLARQYVRYEWSIGDLIGSVTPLDVHQYPLAHSIVAHLEGLGRSRFADFIKEVKNGLTLAAALAASYDGLTIGQLEAGWRSAVREADPVTSTVKRHSDKRTVSEGRPNASTPGDR